MENVLHDTIFDLIEDTLQEELYDGTDFNNGYRSAIYNVLSGIRVKILTYGMNVEEYFGNFDVDEWFKSGKDYKR